MIQLFSKLMQLKPRIVSIQRLCWGDWLVIVEIEGEEVTIGIDRSDKADVLLLPHATSVSPALSGAEIKSQQSVSK